jgi:cell division inhibitor SepF
MAGAMRKMAVYLGLVEDHDDRYDDQDDYDDYADTSRRGSSRSSSSSSRYADEPADDRYSSRSVRPIQDTRAVRTFRGDTTAGNVRPTSPSPSPSRTPELSRIETIHPRNYNDARRIGQDYRDGVPVIMNLSELDDADAKRIIDFAAGLVFGTRGSIERITNKVFLLSPVNVDVGDEARAQIAKDGFFNQS